MSDSDDFAYLPPTLAEIARVAGLPAALTIAETKGGLEVYIPRRAPEGHWLVDCVGREAADKIGAYYGDQRITVPLGDRNFYARARRRAAELLAEGKSLNTVAGQLGVHVRTIKRVKKRVRENGQGRLL